jgi:K+-transporting ATPase ATPase C chain
MSLQMTNDATPEQRTDWKAIAGEARTLVAVVVLLTLLCGVTFPALVIGVGQTVFPGRADGSLIHSATGQVIGSQFIGQNFAGTQYFHSRPSGAGAGGYDASSSSGRNFAPSNPDLVDAVTAAAQAYREENGLSADVVLPADAVTASASGLDPDISPANAKLQAKRVAEARGVTVDAVMAIVDDQTNGRLLGFFGEPRVNVLELNLALDRKLGGGQTP